MLAERGRRRNGECGSDTFQKRNVVHTVAIGGNFAGVDPVSFAEASEVIYLAVVSGEGAGRFAGKHAVTGFKFGSDIVGDAEVEGDRISQNDVGGGYPDSRSDLYSG